MVEVHKMEQQTDPWYEIKVLNPFSSSNAQAIGNQGKGLETLVIETLSSKYSKQKKEHFGNKHTERGNRREPIASSVYKLMTGNSLETVGFITNSKYPMSGASTDSLVNKDGVLEIKCFDDKKHFQIIIEYNQRGTFKIESGYIWQVQMELLITERDWCDFVVYNPNYDDEIFIQRVYPDEEMQQKIKDGIIKGVKMYTEMEKEYLNK